MLWQNSEEDFTLTGDLAAISTNIITLIYDNLKENCSKSSQPDHQRGSIWATDSKKTPSRSIPIHYRYPQPTPNSMNFYNALPFDLTLQPESQTWFKFPSVHVNVWTTFVFVRFPLVKSRQRPKQ